MANMTLLPNEWTVTNKKHCLSSWQRILPPLPEKMPGLELKHLTFQRWSRPTSNTALNAYCHGLFSGPSRSFGAHTPPAAPRSHGVSPDWSKPKTPPAPSQRSQAHRSAASSAPPSHLIYGQRLRTQRHNCPANFTEQAVPRCGESLFTTVMFNQVRLACHCLIIAYVVDAERTQDTGAFGSFASVPVSAAALCPSHPSRLLTFVRALGNTFRVHISRA